MISVQLVMWQYFGSAQVWFHTFFSLPKCQKNEDTEVCSLKVSI